MRKWLPIAGALTACLLAPAFGAGITGTKHDLSAKGYGSTEICIFCHTPHGATASSFGPLWNHAASSATYQLYGGGVTGRGTTVNQPGPASASCLSCHDGTVAVDSYGGATGTNFITGNALVGTDLRDDHPIGVAYPTTGTSYKIPPTVAKTYAGRVECASCHDVHDSTNTPFLRMSNSGSALCLDCHNK
ncbi:MAG: cytochrome c3 family protein [Planctomycetes bacterium]|nr:cytochrome c3 family protein [Planctomycetota bacterium]